MGRTRFDEPQFPPINKLRACIFERKFVGKFTWDDLASAANVSPSQMRKLVREEDPWDWPRAVRLAVCRKLGIKIAETIEDGW